jgi:hypothetical protein
LAILLLSRISSFFLHFWTFFCLLRIQKNLINTPCKLSILRNLWVQEPMSLVNRFQHVLLGTVVICFDTQVIMFRNGTRLDFIRLHEYEQLQRKIDERISNSRIKLKVNAVCVKCKPKRYIVDHTLPSNHKCNDNLMTKSQ